MWLFSLLFFVIAVLSSTVGFGGGVSYLALLTQTDLSVETIKIIALICNIIVVSTTVFRLKNLIIRHLPWVLLVVVPGIPMAFLGGYLSVDRETFSIVAGCALVLGAIFMLLSNNIKAYKSSISPSILGFFSGIIGFVSGLVGIGGGIFLSPLLHLGGYPKRVSIPMITSLYIFSNSLFGLMGIIFSLEGVFMSNTSAMHIIVIPLSVILGGTIGNWFLRDLLNREWIKRLTAAFILVVGVKLLLSAAGVL